MGGPPHELATSEGQDYGVTTIENPVSFGMVMRYFGYPRHAWKAQSVYDVLFKEIIINKFNTRINVLLEHLKMSIKALQYIFAMVMLLLCSDMELKSGEGEGDTEARYRTSAASNTAYSTA